MKRALVCLLSLAAGASASAGTIDFPCFEEGAANEPPGLKAASLMRDPSDLVPIPWDMDFEGCTPRVFSPACHLGFFSNPANTATTSADPNVLLQANTTIMEGTESPPSFSNRAQEVVLKYVPDATPSAFMRAPHSGSRYARLILQGPNMSTTLRMDRPANGSAVKLWFQQAYVGYTHQFPPDVTLTAVVTRGGATQTTSIPLWQDCRQIGVYVPVSPNAVPSGQYFMNLPSDRIVLKLCEYRQAQPLAVPSGAAPFMTVDLTLKSGSGFVFKDTARSCFRNAGGAANCSTFSPMATISVDDFSLEKSTPQFTCTGFDLAPNTQPSCSLSGSPGPFTFLRVAKPDDDVIFSANLAGQPGEFKEPGRYRIDAVCKTPARAGLPQGFCGRSTDSATIFERPKDDFCRFVHQARTVAPAIDPIKLLDAPLDKLKMGNGVPESGFLVYRRPDGSYSAPVETSYSGMAAQLGRSFYDEYNEFGSEYAGVLAHSHPPECAAEVFSVAGGMRTNDSFLAGNNLMGDMESFSRPSHALWIVKAPVRTYLIVKPVGWLPPADMADILAQYRRAGDNVDRLFVPGRTSCERFQESHRIALWRAAGRLKIGLYERPTGSGRPFVPTVP